MAKRLFIVLLISVTSITSSGAFFIRPQKEADDQLACLIKDSFLEKEGALAQLGEFLGNDLDALKMNQRRILAIPLYGSRSLGRMMPMLNSSLFAQREQIFNLVLPDFPLPQSLNNPEALVAQFIRLFLKGDLGRDHFAFDIISYVYNKKSISVDLYNYYDGEDDDDYESIGSMLDDPRQQLYGKAEIADLVKEKRIPYDELVTLVFECLIDKKETKELQNFMARHPKISSTDIKKIKKGEEIMAGWLASKSPYLYPHKHQIQQILLQPVTDAYTSGSHKEKVAAAMVECVQSNDSQSFEEACYLYRRIPISVDEYPYNENVTIGQMLDSTGEKNPRFRTLIKLVQNNRWATPKRDRHYKKFIDLLFMRLARNTDVQKQFDYYIKCCADEGKNLGIISTGLVGDSLDYVRGFIKWLSPKLFPHKQDIWEQLDFGYVERTEIDDHKFIQQLIVAGIKNPVLLPLVEYAHAKYEWLYNGRMIDLFTIEYCPGQSVGSYLKIHPELPQARLYTQLFMSTPKIKSQKGTSVDNEPPKQQPQSPKWLQVALLSIVGAACYACYTYWQKSKRDASLSIDSKTPKSNDTIPSDAILIN